MIERIKSFFPTFGKKQEIDDRIYFIVDKLEDDIRSTFIWQFPDLTAADVEQFYQAKSEYFDDETDAQHIFCSYLVEVDEVISEEMTAIEVQEEIIEEMEELEHEEY